MKKNKYTIFSLIIIAMVGIVTTFSANQNSKLDVGTYIYDTSEILNDSYITINDDTTFNYQISALNSYMPIGIYEINRNKLTLITLEGDILLEINGKNKSITILEDPFSSKSIGRIFILEQE